MFRWHSRRITAGDLVSFNLAFLWWHAPTVQFGNEMILSELGYAVHVRWNLIILILTGDPVGLLMPIQPWYSRLP